MAYTLLFQKSDTLNGDIGTGTGSITLTAGNFTVSGEQLYVIDPDNSSAEVVKATVSGTTMSLTERGVDDTSAVIHSDGASIIMAFVPSHYEALIGSGVPIGSIQMYGGTSAPEDWLICDGAAISRTTYASLFAILGTSYGVGNGSTTFNLPDLRGRVAVGKSTDTEFDALGETGGSKTETLTTSNLPSHSHSASSGTANNDHTHNGTTNVGGLHTHHVTVGIGYGGSGYGDGYGKTSLNNPGSLWYHSYADADGNHQHTFSTGYMSNNHTHTVSVNNTGSGTAHNNIQPYQVVHYIIKAL